MKPVFSLPLLGSLLLLSACGSELAAPAPQLAALALPEPSYYDQGMAIPLYQYPMTAPDVYAPLWTATVAAQQKTGLVRAAVVNANNGPYVGGQPEPNYVRGVAYLRQNRVPVYGYVYSSYAARPLDEVRADIDAWIKSYGVKNFFIDEVSTACNDAAVTDYYSQLAAYIRAKGSGFKIILNPGVVSDSSECLMNYGDIIATFEQSAADYAAFTPPAWTTKYRPRQFWHIIHSVQSQEQQTAVLDASYDKWAGQVYATTDVMPNPYDEQSNFWDAYVNQVGGN